MKDINQIIHQPIRLKILSSLAVLKEKESADFMFLKKIIKTTDGNLGAHLHQLEKVGYIKLEKKFINLKPKTLIQLTKTGRDAFQEYVKNLQSILNIKEKL
jgi:DNA-binding MarR family transcriptional regulator